MEQLELTDRQRIEIIRKKATCPFIGSAVAGGDLPVFGSVERPLAKVEDVVRLGDSGGGDLGSHVLQLFAVGNHSRLPDPQGAFNGDTVDGFFSLDFPGSKGAHPGDSGILIENPLTFESGRLCMEAFERLRALADDAGMLGIAAVGRFIADNVRNDDRTRSDRGNALPTLGRILGDVADRLGERFHGRSFHHQDHVRFLEDFTSAISGDDLVRSAGEFGLLFALLANRPDAIHGKIKLSDVEAMMVRAELPEGWRDWPKRLRDWVESTGEIAFAAWRSAGDQVSHAP